jgi:hypothetical protein
MTQHACQALFLSPNFLITVGYEARFPDFELKA